MARKKKDYEDGFEEESSESTSNDLSEMEPDEAYYEGDYTYGDYDERSEKEQSSESTSTEEEEEEPVYPESDGDLFKSSGNESVDWNALVKDANSDNPRIRKYAEEQAILALNNWVIAIVNKRFPTYYKMAEDLAQEGRMAILVHLKEYDPSASSATNFFFRHILHAVQVHVQNQGMHLTRHYGDMLTQINRAVKKLRQQNPTKEPDPLQIHMATGIPVATIISALSMKASGSEIPLDDIPSAHSEDDNPESKILKDELNSTIARSIQQLPVEEREVILLAYGFETARPCSIREIATRTGLSTDRCHTLLQNAKRHLYLDRQLASYATGNYSGEKRKLDKRIPFAREKVDSSAPAVSVSAFNANEYFSSLVDDEDDE